MKTNTELVVIIMPIPYIAILIISLFLQSPAFAADENKAFAIKGAGITDCKRFVESASKRDNLYFMYGSWLEGYMTASNLHLKQTFDIAPWQSTQLLLKVIESICKKNPTSKFHQVANSMISELSKQRLDVGRKYIDVNGDRKYVYQEEVIRRIKLALKKKDLFTGEINSNFDDELVKSIKEFQKSLKHQQTGLPDQGTLYELFRK